MGTDDAQLGFVVAQLAEALDERVPDDISVRADGYHLAVEISGVWWLTYDLGFAEGRSRRGVADVIMMCLNRVQDLVTEHLREPWPKAPSSASYAMWVPTVDVVDGGFRAFFGESESPVLELPLIESTEKRSLL